MLINREQTMTVSRWLLAFLVAILLAGAVPASSAAQLAAQRVQIPSLDRRDGSPQRLDGWWFPAPGDTRAPAVILLHGCAGMLDVRGEPNPKTRNYAALMQAHGWHALALDSLTPRGEKQLCTQRIGTRRITMTQRRRDALGALQWLVAQPVVDPARLALLGWSNGGSTVLAATNLNHPEVAAATVWPRLAVAFYPGCEADLRRGYRPSAEALLLVGLADDWTAAAPCQALARDTPPRVTVVGWEGAYHGFDQSGPVRHRSDVPNGVNPGQGVHVGGQPQARQASQRLMVEEMQRAFAR